MHMAAGAAAMMSPPPRASAGMNMAVQGMAMMSPPPSKDPQLLQGFPRCEYTSSRQHEGEPQDNVDAHCNLILSGACRRAYSFAGVSKTIQRKRCLKSDHLVNRRNSRIHMRKVVDTEGSDFLRSIKVASGDVDGVDVIAGERGCKTSSAPVTYIPYKRQPLSANSVSMCPTCLTFDFDQCACSATFVPQDASIWHGHLAQASDRCALDLCCLPRCKTTLRQNYYASARGPRIV